MKIYKTAKIILVLLFLTLYISLAVMHSNKVNTDINYPDQKPYADAAIKIRNSNFWYLGDRNRMPVYPYIQSLFYSPGLSQPDYFLRGKYVNIILSLVSLFLVFIVASKYLHGLPLVNFMLVAAFALFVLKAAYFQVEDLFYSIYFLCFILFVNYIKKPSPKLGIITGLAAGVAYLTKATTLLGFSTFILFLLIETIYTSVKQPTLIVKTLLLRIIPIVAVFLIILSPYLTENKKIFGKYFYNTGTNFYFWYDSIQEAHDGTGTHGETLGWPTLPQQEIPNARKYFSEHSLYQSVQRLGTGFLKTILFMIWSYAVIPFSFLIFFSIFFIYFAVLQRQKLFEFFKKNAKLLTFFILYFSAHILAFSWYAVVDSGPRFLLTIFLPFIFLLAYTIEHLSEEKKVALEKYFNLLSIVLLLASIKISIIPILQSVYTGF